MFKQLAGIALATFLFGGVAEAASVSCPPNAVSGRFVTVSPGLVNGLCAFDDNNLDVSTVIDSALNGVGALLIDKDTTTDFPTGDPSESFLQWTRTDAQSGTWTVQDLAWDNNIRLFLGFHFGNGGGSPDSFVVELARRDLTGTYALNAISPARLNGLSNIYLFGRACTDADDCDDRPPTGIPAPGVLGLLAVGLLGLGARARRS